MKTEKHKGDGHRSRLRKRFLENGFDGFLDYEIIELLLTLGTPRRDCKDTAKLTIAKFGGIADIFYADLSDLKQIKGIGDSNIFGLKLARALIETTQKEIASHGGLSADNVNNIIEYLRSKIGHLDVERFVILCCDSKGKLIDDIISIGSLNSSVVHPREVYKLAMRNNADSIIIAHNHPSGNPTPSADDIYTTRKLEESGKIVGIKLIDHLIISNDISASMRELGYIKS